jgi:hypothetical protein
LGRVPCSRVSGLQPIPHLSGCPRAGRSRESERGCRREASRLYGARLRPRSAAPAPHGFRRRMLNPTSPRTGLGTRTVRGRRPLSTGTPNPRGPGEGQAITPPKATPDASFSNHGGGSRMRAPPRGAHGLGVRRHPTYPQLERLRLPLAPRRWRRTPLMSTHVGSLPPSGARDGVPMARGSRHECSRREPLATVQGLARAHLGRRPGGRPPWRLEPGTSAHFGSSLPIGLPEGGSACTPPRRRHPPRADKGSPLARPCPPDGGVRHLPPL